MHARLADLELPAHQQAIVELLDLYARDDFGAGQPLAAETRANLIGGLKYARATVFLAANEPQHVSGESHFIGLAICLPSFSSFRALPVLNIHDLAVHPDFRGQGVGRSLLAAIEQEARRGGCCKITLEVRADNLPAQRLYRDVGLMPLEPQNYFWAKTLIAPATAPPQ